MHEPKGLLIGLGLCQIYNYLASVLPRVSMRRAYTALIFRKKRWLWNEFTKDQNRTKILQFPISIKKKIEVSKQLQGSNFKHRHRYQSSR